LKTVQDEDMDFDDLLADVLSLGETMPGIAPVSAVGSQGVRTYEGINDMLDGDVRPGMGRIFGYSKYSVGKLDQKSSGYSLPTSPADRSRNRARGTRDRTR
jgi:hypothetical protein